MIIPTTLSSGTSLTHIYNLCEVVNKALLQSKHGIHIFNVVDKAEYQLKSVFGEILQRKIGKRSFLSVHVSLLRFMIAANSKLGRKSQLSKQALDYLTQNSMLSIEKAERELNYLGAYNFYDSIEMLDLGPEKRAFLRRKSP
jgi:hypothetical protein